MTEPAIKPALTAEEWAADSIRRDTPSGDVLVIVRDTNPSTQEAGGHHHALAAIALNGKPFGFSMEDLTAIEEARGALDNEQYGCAQRLASLAARIAALLPPE